MGDSPQYPDRPKRIPIMVTRVSISIQRKSIVSLKLRLEQLKEETKPNEVRSVVSYYETLVKLRIKNSYFRVHDSHLSHFEAVHFLCSQQKWDYKLYLEVQFKRSEPWLRFKFPLPSHLYSLSALKYFTNYLATIRFNYEKSLDKKSKESRQFKTLNQRIKDDISSSAKILYSQLKHIRRKNISLEEGKVYVICNNWKYLSPFYLSSIPWFEEYISDPTNKNAQKYIKDMRWVKKDRFLNNLVSSWIEEVEKQYNLPSNI